jgi:hypothetical protein
MIKIRKNIITYVVFQYKMMGDTRESVVLVQHISFNRNTGHLMSPWTLQTAQVSKELL